MVVVTPLTSFSLYIGTYTESYKLILYLKDLTIQEQKDTVSRIRWRDLLRHRIGPGNSRYVRWERTLLRQHDG